MFENEMYPILWDEDKKRVGLVFRNWVFYVNELNLIEFHVNGQPDQIIDAYLEKLRGKKDVKVNFITKEELEKRGQFINHAKIVLDKYLQKQVDKEKYEEIFDKDLSKNRHSVARWALNQACQIGLLPNEYCLVEKEGDCLSTMTDILLHQVNLDGIMGGGIALQIATKYPSVEREYTKYNNKVLGEVLFTKVDNYVIGNCFSQDKNFNTDYEALKKCLEKVKKYMDINELYSIAIPYKYGCGIANGDWDVVKKIFIDAFKGYQLVIYKL